MRSQVTLRWIGGGLFVLVGLGLVAWMAFADSSDPPEPGRARDLPVDGSVIPIESVADDADAAGWLATREGGRWIAAVGGQLESLGLPDADTRVLNAAISNLASAHVHAKRESDGFAAYEAFMISLGAKLNSERSASIADRYWNAVLNEPSPAEWNTWSGREKIAHVWKHAESRGVAWTGVFPEDVDAGVGGWTRTAGDTAPTFASQFSIFDRPASLRDGTPDVERAERGGIVWVEFAVELGGHPRGTMRVRYRIYLAKDTTTGEWMPIRADTGGAGPSFPVLLI